MSSAYVGVPMSKGFKHVMDYMGEVSLISKEISYERIEALAVALSQVKGRIYICLLYTSDAAVE